MRFLDILRLRLRTLLHRDSVDRELEEELRHHLDLYTQRNMEAGMPPAEARGAALRATGGVAHIQEECRDARGFRYLADLAQDLRYAARAMRRSPGITIVAVASLALGIGANTAVFSLINTVMLRSLPVAHPDQLIRLDRVYQNRQGVGNFSYPFFLQLQEENAATADLLASNRLGTTRVMAPGSAVDEQAAREMVTGEYFSALGVHASLGRTITPEDNRMPNGNPVAVISYSYWKRRFATDPSILGKTLTVADAPLTVIGVAPPEFFGVEVGSATDIWVPLATMPQKKWLVQNGFNFLSVLGRLKPGVSIAQAGAKCELVLTRANAARLGSIRNPRQRQNLLDQHIAVEPAANGFSRLRDQFSEPLRVLLAIVAGVLLIACSNIANLQLARASAREREIGVRLAIGAGRLRLVRQLLTESVLLSLAGGLCGVAFAYWGCQALLGFVPKSDAPLVVDLHPDARVLAFTLGVSLLSGILFGFGPALRSTHTNLDTALKSESRSVGYNPARRWLGRSLIAGQVALSMLLLVGSGLFIRTLMKLQAADLGFDREHVLTFGINVLAGKMVDTPGESQLIDRIVGRAQSIPGVRAVSYSFGGGYGIGHWGSEVHAEGYTPRDNEPLTFDGARVGPRYFEAMGIPLLAGRGFSERDNEGAPKVVVVNQSMARHFFANSVPLGRRIRYELQTGGVDAEIVGVVKDVQHHGARKGPPAMFYAPALQSPGPWPNFELRAAGAPAAMIAALRRELPALQAGLTVVDPATLDEQVNASLARERLVASISGFFGGIALLLACIGVYGTMAYNVTRRTAEVGIRMTLGARRSEVVWMILREALALVSMGVVIGAVAARGVTRSIASLLFGLEPGDVTTVVVAAAAMLIVAVIAGYLPARRAASVDPMMALRCE
ncbi:MAG TPA: ABC transporter permease [Bryobacteraceae bacterium]|nr:ABC transporter permease [Bryobacteraceae bacterium]